MDGRIALIPGLTGRWQRWRGWIVGATALVLGGCYGALSIGEPATKLGTETNGLMHAMWAQFPELRASAIGMEESKSYKSMPIKPVESTVPFVSGHIWLKPGAGGLQCDRARDSYCLAFIVGDQVREHPGLLERIEATLRNICASIPVPLQPYAGEGWNRRNDVQRLRQWAGCDGATRESRTIVLYVVRNVDGLVVRDQLDRRNPPTPDPSWPQHVVEKRTFFVNE